MSYTDVSANFAFGLRVFAANVKIIHDNYTAVASGDSGSPKFQRLALARGPAIGVNNPVISVSCAQVTKAANSQHQHLVTVNSMSFVPAGFVRSQDSGFIVSIGSASDGLRHARLECPSSDEAVASFKVRIGTFGDGGGVFSTTNYWQYLGS